MLLVEGGLVYDHARDTDRPAQADILIDGNRIAAVAPDLRTLSATPGHALYGRIPAGVAMIDARDRLVLPGFFNAHYHSHDTLLKGFFETLPVELWSVLALPPSFPRRSRRELRARTLIGAVECLHGGITTVQDMDRIHPFDAEDVDAVLQAYDEVGIRCIFAPHVSERSPLDSTAYWRETIPEPERWRLSSPAGPLFPPGVDIARAVEAFIRPRRGRYARITFGVGPSSADRLTRHTLEALADLSRREAIPYYIHLNESRAAAIQGPAEHGGSHVRYLRSCGVLGRRTSLAHSVWLTDAEIGIIAETGATAVLCPVGNLKTRSGVPRIRDMLAAGVNVGLGCDNCSCSDAQNMFQAMKMFCGLAAVSDSMPGPPSASDALRAACCGGALPAGLDGELGALRPGMLADMLLLDLGDTSFVPFNNAARQVVFTESGRAVRTVIVDGRVVRQDGRITTIDEVALRGEIADLMLELTHDAARVADRILPIRSAILEAVRRSSEPDLPIHRLVGSAGIQSVAAGRPGGTTR